MTPSNLSSKLLDKLLIGVGFGKSPHVEEVRARESLDIRKLPLQVFGQTLDHLAAPPLLLLALQDVAADLPIE